MKRYWICIVLLLFEIILLIACSFMLQNILSVETCLNITFCVSFIVLFASLKDEQNKTSRLIETLSLSVLLTLISFGIFSYGNQLHGEYIEEYDVVVEYVNSRGGGHASFTTPDGKEETVELNDRRPVITNEDDCVNVGDTIKVQKYRGIFNKHYFIFVEQHISVIK